MFDPSLATVVEVGPMSAIVSFHEITRDTVRAICLLKVAPEQEQFVAPNALSIAQAHFEPAAWFRAIHAGETPVGFVMLRDRPGEDFVYLWRFMIDAAHQRRGHGDAALRLIIARARARPGTRALTLNYIPGEGSPWPFYQRFGFAPTGAVHDGEIECALALSTPKP